MTRRAGGSGSGDGSNGDGGGDTCRQKPAEAARSEACHGITIGAHPPSRIFVALGAQHRHSLAGCGIVTTMRLLIVEDEHRMAAAMQRGLVHAGFTVDVAGDGISGLEMATAVGYDVIVLDVMLPGLSGYEVTRQLRAREIWTPILLASAKDGDYDQADGLDLGADDYLTKPFSFVVLLARIRALLRRGALRPTTIRLGRRWLDPRPCCANCPQRR